MIRNIKRKMKLVTMEVEFYDLQEKEVIINKVDLYRDTIPSITWLEKAAEKYAKEHGLRYINVKRVAITLAEYIMPINKFIDGSNKRILEIIEDRSL